jgi:hypothetical protein
MMDPSILTAEEYQATVKRPSKYHAKPTVVDGIKFASKAEARRYGELTLLERVGKIKDIVLQPRVPIDVNGVRIGTYVADFMYVDVETGETVYEDVKGVKTPVYNLKKRLVAAIHGIKIKEVAA